ncbi:hypothetical protein [Streptodolium elevatio]|uniref:Uncharacterized protein n=1 Tax=Streptodolium elevatio TaxID=3157996 RepID=A0ABV3DPW6_9ACTN
MRRAARDLLLAGPIRPEDGGALGTALCALVSALVTAARWNAAAGHRQQAAASQAAELAWRAYQESSPVRQLTAAASTLPPAVRARHAATATTALPEHLRGAVTPAGIALLAGTLAEAEHAGHHPQSLIIRAVTSRELDTATDPAHVLTWRIRRLADLPAPTRTAPRTATGHARRTNPAPADDAHGRPRPSRT